jgi:hypothetical protein
MQQKETSYDGGEDSGNSANHGGKDGRIYLERLFWSLHLLFLSSLQFSYSSSIPECSCVGQRPYGERAHPLLTGLETKAFSFFWCEVALKRSPVRRHGMPLAARGFPRGGHQQ